jgi:hypothetical protein
MIMEVPPRATSDSESRQGPAADSRDAEFRRRLALLDDFKTSIQALKREPTTRWRFQMNDPTLSATAHAAANIAQWRSYLPEDCVTAMISAGWQWST